MRVTSFSTGTFLEFHVFLFLSLHLLFNFSASVCYCRRHLLGRYGICFILFEPNNVYFCCQSVTSSSRRTKITKFRWKNRNVRFKMADPAGTENRERSRKTHIKHPHPARERSPRNRSIPEITGNRRVAPSPSEDVPASSGARRMSREMKKLRSLHILHVPFSRSKTSWHRRLMFPQSVVPYLWFLKIFGDVWPLFSLY